jgi:hypothetical protein
MKNLNQLLVLTGVALTLAFSGASVLAQAAVPVTPPAGAGGGGASFRGGGNFGGGGGGAGGMGRLTALTGEPDPSVDALQTVLDNNAPIAEVKAAMAKVREARLQKRAVLLKAQQDLKDVLSTRQEAVLLLSGQLD